MHSPAPFHSLRWRLPLSYAAIALLAVLALGATLLGTLRSFYGRQELAYLSGNATVIAEEIAPLLAAGDRSLLQSRIAGFSFLTQARIEVLDDMGQIVLADSGEQGALRSSIALSARQDGLSDVLGAVEEQIAIVVEEERQTEDGGVTSQRTITTTSRLPAQGSLYGFNLGEASASGGERSNRAVQTGVVDESGAVLGQVRLSQGPAYGRAILRSVAWGWTLAGAVAVLLAALMGWLISRRLTQPLLALTAVTGRMAAGDLGARAEVRREDEVGALGQSFNLMATQVENTVASLRRFTADAAHELHTPLTALQTDLQLLEAGDQLRQQRVARAQDQARRLQALADNLLELSRLEADAPVAESQLLNLCHIVQISGELYASQAEQANLDFAMTVLQRPLMVRGDASQLQRALANILDNSLKFTPAPGQIILSLQAQEDTAVIAVGDSGIGIPAEDVSQLFGRFHRARNAAGYAGSGLGLAIVQEIMARHQGRATIESGERGTTVRLVLPLEPSEE